ncbi:MAG TPA: hypothetical protein VGH10_07960 [Actinomycetota bacterium]
MTGRRAAAWDAGLYGGSALFALGAALAASIPLYREWGRLAAPAYAVAAIIAALLAVRGTAGVRVRTWLAVAVFVLAALVPLATEATWRANTGAGLHVQSEAIVTEQAARALIRGRDPYAASFVRGPLAARPAATATHFPYLPGMLVFGVPRALDGTSPLSDARVWFALGTLLAAWIALRAWRGPPPARLRAGQVLLALPTGALLMATGGDDLPVLALLLLSFVLFDADGASAAGSGAVAGAASALKQPGWVAVPFLAVAAWRRGGRREGVRFLATWAAIALPLTVAFAAWNPSAFVEDAIRFPLGIGQGRSAAGTPTLGSALTDAMPGLRGPLTVTFAAIVAATAVLLLIRLRPASAAAAAGACGVTLAVALVLAPAARIGYAVYPINLLTWAWLLNRSVRSSATANPSTSSGSGSAAPSTSRT